jgi:capsular polysaccharide biosynthesis protein
MMQTVAETVLHQRPIEAFGPLGLLGPGKPVEHRHSLAPARVALPPLATGRLFLERWQVRELPEPGAWAHPHYDSYAPPLFVLHNVLVHSSAGIIAVGDQVIAETLSFTEPNIHAYRNLVRGIAIRRGAIRRLAGTHVAALTAGETNYYHSMMFSLARLQAVPGNYLAAAASLLVPRGAVAQPEVLALLDLLPSLAVETVGHDETLLVENLIFPLSVCGEASYHPCVADFFRRVSANVPPPARRLPRRIYIDRRGSGIRRLTNENALIAALAPLGFVPVRPETLSVADQVRLFRHAEAIVAPHGAALTNIGYARPGCLLIELLMDAYVNWCFRHLAALMQLRYDCVLGLAPKPWADLNLQFHLTPWTISVNHVVAAVAQGLGETAKAA